MSGEEHIEGRNPVYEALQAGQVLYRIMIARGARGDRIREIIVLAEAKKIPVHFVERDQLEKMTISGKDQGVIAQAPSLDYCQPEVLFSKADTGSESRRPLLVLLDGVQDPQNLGSIIRSAEAAGADGVVIPERRSAGLTTAVVRASAGAAYHLPVARVKNLSRTIEDLKKRGYWLVGADMDGTPLWEEEFDFNLPVGLVLGAEGRGLRRLVRDSCDLVVSLPMRGQVGSLNVSVATGIILFEILRRRWEK